MSGATLRFRLDLPDAWASFERQDSASARAAKSEAQSAGEPSAAAGGGAPPEPVTREP